MDATQALRHPDIMPNEDFEAARLTVRLDAIAANYRTYRRLTGPAAVAAVVKADAYGLGADMVAPALVRAGCDSFFVARLAEGVALRSVAPNARIFVLDGAQPDAVPALLTHRLTPVLNSLAEIAAWSAAAASTRTTLDAVVHVDTGINRLGMPGEELSVLAAEARARLAGLNLVLVMSHLACADDAAHAQNATQLSRFHQALAMLPPAPASLAASHGAMLGPDYHFDLVRPGVALYGANPGSSIKGAADANLMQTAAVLTAKVLQVRRIDSGDSVGYAAIFRAKRPTMLATIALGYADGIPRSASNKGFAMVKDTRVAIAGRVSMDLTVLDVTGVDVAVGDCVEMLGDTITLGEVARVADTSAWEILTRLHRVPRHYRSEGVSRSDQKKSS